MPESYAKRWPENNVDFIPRFVEGPYEIPMLKPESYEKELKWIPFNYAGSMHYKREEYGVHFFISDYQFQRLWTAREKYAKMITEYGAFMTPDFSPYTDWPFMVQIWNHYRKHLLGAWMQELGCIVYPTVTWTDEKSWKWCFDGEPWRGTVCVSSVGMMKNKENYRMMVRGYDKMMEVLEPETILFYGKIPKECTGNIVPIEPHYKRFQKGERNDQA